MSTGRQPRKFSVAVILGLVLAVLPAQASELLDVRGVVENVFPGPGGETTVQAEWGVFNISTETTVSVLLNGYIVYANGVRQQVFPPTVEKLAPGQGTIRLGFVVVPDAAASGAATFHTEARPLQIDPPVGHTHDVVTDSDGFTVP